MMMDCIREAGEEQAALHALYDVYRNSLPRYKQDVVAPALPLPLLNLPGLICFEAGQPVAGLLWKEYSGSIVVAEFYAESPKASRGSIEKLVAAFTSATASARARYFELWTSDQAKVPQVLLAKGFQNLPKKLLALREPVYSPARWNEFRFLSLRNFDLSPSSLQVMARLIHETYVDTTDGTFYDEYRHLDTCLAYVSRVLESPLCDYRNSWLAWSPFANKLAGIALCYIWPRTSVLYLEQLAVHPSFRRKGLGRALLSSVCSPLAEGAIGQVLLTISRDNLPAFQLCQAAKVEVLHQELAFVLRSNPPPEPQLAAGTAEPVASAPVRPRVMEPASLE